MEAYRPLFEDAGWTQAGSFEWVVHSRAWASEWANNTQAGVTDVPDPSVWPEPHSPWPSWHRNETVHVPDPTHRRQWHEPSTLLLQPGESRTYAIRFTLAAAGREAGGPAGRDAALREAGRVVLHGVPGFVLAADMSGEGGAKLIVERPTDAIGVASIESSDPTLLSTGAPTAATADAAAALVVRLAVGRGGGRVRLTLTFTDGSVGTAHYLVVPAPSLREHVSSLDLH